MSNNLINNNSIYSLRGLLSAKTIQVLNLSNNSFTDEGLKLLLDKLISCSSLKELNLSSDIKSIKKIRLGQEGAHLVAHLIDRNSSLRKLILGNNEIGIFGISVITDCLKNNESLKELNISHSYFDYDSLHSLLTHNDSLENLILTRNSIQDDTATLFCKQLERNMNLKVLDLSYNELTSSFCLSLVPGLNCAHNLVSLSLENNKIGSKGVKLLADSLVNSEISSLNISYNMVDEDGISYLFEKLKYSKVRNLKISGNSFTQNCLFNFKDWLKFSSFEKNLHFSECQINDILAISIFESLDIYSNVISLNLSFNLITETIANEIIFFIKKNPNLLKVNINRNRMLRLTEKKIVSILKKKLKNIDKKEPLKYELKISKLNFKKQIIQNKKNMIKKIENQISKINTSIKAKEIEIQRNIKNENEQRNILQMKIKKEKEAAFEKQEIFNKKVQEFEVFKENLKEQKENKKKKIEDIKNEIEKLKNEENQIKNLEGK